jgi:glycine/D-amino acid oxidase-like deaminating enzyme
MLVGAVETSIEDLINQKGPKAAAHYLKYQKTIQQEVRQLIQKENIRCDLENRSLYYFQNESSVGEYYENSISVNPPKFAHGIAAYLRKNGVHMYENTPLLSTTGKTAHTPGGTITFDTIINARGTSEINKDLANYVTTICVTRTLTKKEIQQVETLNRSMFFCDGKKSYHYGKITHDRRLLIGYGDVRRKSLAAKAKLHAPHVRSIQRFMKQMLGMNPEMEYAWSAAFSLTQKPLPYVSLSDNAVGGAGTQIASIAAASYLASRLLKHKHPLENVF